MMASTKSALARSATTNIAPICLALLVLAGCEIEETLSPVPGPLKGTLSLELRDSAELQIASDDGVNSTVTITLSEGFGFAPANTTLEAPGRIEPFPEANSTLYWAKLDAPGTCYGRCVNDSVSLAMSLYREGNNAIVLGGLSAYCGANTWHGTPKRVLRLNGPLSSSP